MCVAVEVGVFVAVEVGIDVGVGVSVGTDVGVSVGVCVCVTVGVAVGVWVGKGDSANSTTTHPMSALAPELSRCRMTWSADSPTVVDATPMMSSRE